VEQIGILVEKSLDVDELSAAILDSSMKVCRADLGEIIIRDGITDELKTIISRGAGGNSPFQATTQREVSLADWLRDNDEPILLNHIHRDPRFSQQAPGEPVVRSLLAVPLQRGFESFGFLAVMNKQKGLFTSEDLEILKAVAEKGQMAIENARLHAQTDERLRERVREFANLAGLGVALSATLDLDDLLETAVTHASRTLHVPLCDIRLVEGAQLCTRAAVGFPGWSMDQPAIDIADQLQMALEDLKPLVIEDLNQDSLLPASWRRAAISAGARCYLGMPLVARGSSLGIISFCRTEPHNWQTHEIDLAMTVANTIASAVANAQLFQVVSERKRWTELVLRGLGDGVMTTDREGRIDTFNPVAERITGWSMEELAGRRSCELFNPRGQGPGETESCPCPHHAALLVEPDSGFRAKKRQFVRPDGTQLTLATTAAPLYNSANDWIGTVTIFRDISEAERQDQLQADLISMISHELRAPLTNIMLSVDLLRRGVATSWNTHEVVDLLHSQTERLHHFVEDVLTATRLETGRTLVQLRPLPVAPLLERTVRATLIRSSQRRFEITVQPDLPYVLADASKVEVVVHNLLTNAVNYSSPDSLIKVGARADGNGASVIITVTDEGIGIASEHREHIFDRFYRVNSSESQSASGFGLGLYLCKRLIEAQNGEIWAESELGAGSQFSVRLPVATEG
jgi:PAS domain S-box-containing protein